MPPVVMKSKPKGREGRQSRSRNTTPSSGVEVPLSNMNPSNTAYTDIPIANLMIPTNISYDDILERHGGNGGIPDPSHLNTMAKDLKQLGDLAISRGNVCNAGMRVLADRRKVAILEEERERERERERREREQATRARESEERRTLKREAEEEDDARERKGSKNKKRKERSTVREERPPNHGAHGPARQDGLDLPLEASPSQIIKASASPPKRKLDAISGRSSSSLSEASPIASPSTAPPLDPTSPRATPTSSTSGEDTQQPPPAANITQWQTFGPNPLTFDDPTIYDIRPITEDMADDEKKEIFCVASFPHDDLKDLIAGTPPNKDFSMAVKPNNQVAAHTFSAYLDNYLRPLKEEDIGFLNERGDRTTPFMILRRGKRSYKEIWDEEDGSISRETPEQDRLPPNQPRGNLDQMTDKIAETDQISSGPLLNRLLSTMRFEHRAPPEENAQANGLTNGTDEPPLTNGDLPNGISHEQNSDDPNNKTTSLPPATALPPADRHPTTALNLTHAQIDERLKAELRHIGFLAPDDEPDYDSHRDDEIAERLRYLQDELRRVSILNGARKQRVLDLAQEQMAYQEYATILEDLDGQVQQAYLKRSRTMKSKKNAKRPGGAGGGSHPVHGGVSTDGGVSKPGIGDVARQLMTRRAKWQEKIGPVFRPDIRRVRGKGEGIFGDGVMEPLVRMEKERWEEEAEG